MDEEFGDIGEGAGGAAPATSMDAAMSSIRREAGIVDPEREARVKQILSRIARDKEFYEKGAFKRIKEDIKFAANLESEQWQGDKDKYVANITLKHVRDRSAELYAKNPRVRAKRAERMDFQVWDEKAETLQSAMITAQTAIESGLPLPPEIEALMVDVQQAKMHRDMIDRVGKTLTILYHHYLDAPQPRFKKMMKSAVKRAISGSIAWVKLSYQRQYEKNPGVLESINDITQNIARVETMIADFGDGLIEEGTAKVEELRQALAVLQSKQDVLVNEGIVHTFPMAHRVILDKHTTQISGFVGTRWMTEEFLLTVDEVKDLYEIDVSSSFTAYATGRNGVNTIESGQTAKFKEGAEDLCCVYEHYDKVTGTFCVVCEGYPDYLKEPGPPPVAMKRFFPYFPIMFNEIEMPEGQIYPPSDVRLLMHQAQELNRSREALRQHRISAQPFYVSTKGNMSEDDKDMLRGRVPHTVLDLDGLPPGTKIEDVIQLFKSAPIDPNLYETNPIFEDALRTVGSQEANFGSAAGGTATESSIAEGGRISSLASATDDLDETLTELARAAGEVLLMETSPETVAEIVGPGAVWPGMARQQMADEVFLEIIAGSNGRPNKAQDIANMERVGPMLTQTPGINPAWVARKVVETLDSGIDMAEALLDGAPSIIAMNAATKAAQSPAGRSSPNKADARGNPEDQGDNGGNNEASPPMGAPGAQPSMPSPVGVT